MRACSGPLSAQSGWCGHDVDVDVDSALMRLDLSNCSSITHLAGLAGLSAHKHLALSNCSNITDAASLSGQAPRP